MNEVGLTILGGLCIVSVSCAGQRGKKEVQKQPNIVFLLADDLRWNSLNCMGNKLLHTDNIDELAENGIRFTNACVTTSISMVSRASILTGQYMSRHKIREFGKSLSEQAFAETYPAILRRAGYWTGFVGKYGVGQIRESDFDFAREYERVHWFPLENGDSIHVTERNALDALEFLGERPKDKPFLLSVSFFATHAQDNHPDQYRYQPESEKFYRNDVIPVPETASDEYFRRLPPFIANEANEGRIRWHWRFDTPEKYQKYMKAYYRMLTEVDMAVGRIVTELKDQGVYENTLIIFMGDNGYFHGEHGLADKWYPYEESLRVPFIVYDPRLEDSKRNKTIDEFVLNIDIAPAVISAARLEIPDGMQGEDFSGLYLSGKPLRWRKDFYYEHPFVTSEKRIPSSEALVTHTSKYIFWPHYQYEEYFDLKKDPMEKNNLINQRGSEGKISEMKSRFLELKSLVK
ncbi:MAG TPA: sulfatase [Bacteroidales bacterium]|nr:sulfatase [Bacteroidales bacterium]